MRQNIFDLKGVRFIDDTYNANPDSMMAAIDVLKSIEGPGQKDSRLRRYAGIGRIF